MTAAPSRNEDGNEGATFMVAMYTDPAETMSAPQIDEIDRKHGGLRSELTASGKLLNGAGLADAVDTAVVRLHTCPISSSVGRCTRQCHT